MLIETVALIVAETEGIDVVTLPTEIVFKLVDSEVDDKLKVVPEARLGLEIDTEVEGKGQLVDERTPVSTLVVCVPRLDRETLTDSNESEMEGVEMLSEALGRLVIGSEPEVPVCVLIVLN